MTNQPLPPSSHFSLSQMVRLIFVIALSVRLDSPGVVCFIVISKFIVEIVSGMGREGAVSHGVRVVFTSMPCLRTNLVNFMYCMFCIICSGISYVSFNDYHSKIIVGNAIDT
jgi:hypothetical protein